MTDSKRPFDLVRSALFLPASNPRAIEKARTLAADMVILDLEDAVEAGAKDRAREAAVEAAARDWGDRLVAVRVNGAGTLWHAADMAALAGVGGLDALVLPKVEALPEGNGIPLIAMIESPAGLYAARDIAAAPGVAGLMVGANDLAAALRLPPGGGRAQLALALQMVLLAARAAGVAAYDGVYNAIDDATGFAADCLAARAAGFDGKSLIHPAQVDPANRLFGPTPAELEEARALVAAARGGAERFRGRMIEAMHVETARRALARG